MKKAKNIWEEHPQVVHYTDQVGLEGILTSQELHATHYDYLNDTSELKRMEGPLAKAVAPLLMDAVKKWTVESSAAAKFVRAHGAEAICLSEAQKFVNTLHKVTFGQTQSFFEPYFLSFCVHKDEHQKLNGLLSQWRAYGRGSGYAIVFDTRALCDMLANEAAEYIYAPVNIGDVVYDGDSQGFLNEFDELLTEIQRSIREIWFSKPADLKELYTRFVGSVSRFKDGGFAEEQEVRAALSPWSAEIVEAIKLEQPDDYEKHKGKKVKEVRFRAGMVPYLAVQAMDGRLPILGVVIGPHREKNRRRQILERFLKMKKIDVPVTVSATPFV